MTELTQLYTIAEHGRGDCWRTAFACVLGKEKPEDVPDFVYNEDGQLNDNWFADTVNWLYNQGYELASVGLGDGKEFPQFSIDVARRLINETYVVDGLSPRVRPDGQPIYHACVATDLQVIHDPHPDAKDLLGYHKQLGF